MSCLVVEDDPLTGAMLAEVLAANGWSVQWATNLADARAKLEAFDPDLLVLDVMLGRGPCPGSSLPLVREQGRTRRVVFLTGLSEASLDEVRREFPAADVLQKPATAEQIVRVIGRGRKGVVA